MKPKKYKRLSLKERIIKHNPLEEGKSKSFVALKLHCLRSTTSRKIEKWPGGKDEKYDARRADWHAKDDCLNKRNLDKIHTNYKLKSYVHKSLLKGWSPARMAVESNSTTSKIMPCEYPMRHYERLNGHGAEVL